MNKIETKKYPVRYVAYKNPGKIIENLNGDIEKCCFYDTRKKGRHEGAIYVEIAYHIGKQQYVVSFYVEYPNITREYESGDKFFKHYEDAYQYFLKKIEDCYDFWKLKPIYEIRFQGHEIVEETNDIRIRDNMIITEDGTKFEGWKYKFKCRLE